MDNRPFVGVWLDHREAFLIQADEQADMQTLRVGSDYQETIEPADRACGPGPGGGGAVPHASVERRRKEQLNHYYKRLTKALRAAEHIYLFGPGQAKKEFARALQAHKEVAGRIGAVENARQMTQPQMAARVREFFDLPRGRR